MLSKAGLRKLTIIGRKVKVEFLLQDLPAAGGKGSCRLCYLLGGQEKEKSWDIVFVSGGRQMHFLQKLEEAEEIEGIVDCRIFLPGGKEIRGEADAVTEEKQNVEKVGVKVQIPDIEREKKPESKSEERQLKKSEEWKETKQKSRSEECQMKKPESKSEECQMKRSESKSEERQLKKSEEWKETKQKPKSEECQMKKPESKSEERQIKKTESDSEVAPGDEERSQEMQNKSRVETKESRKETEIPENQVLYIQDLTQLLSMGEKQRELYYNSFLLHGYYQYRHVVAGDGFIGVPGNFSQREAIAAKMMGFPLFIEAENLQHCEIGEETRTEMPQMGAYGYFLCKVK